MIEIVTPPRGIDSWGDGAYGARRGKRTHKGEDYAAWPESVVLNKVAGEVSKIGFPYPPDDPVKGFLRYVEILTPNNYRIRYFYVRPMCAVGDYIAKRQALGLVQDLRQAYDQKMTPHVHLEILDSSGNPVKPTLYFSNGTDTSNSVGPSA